MKKNQADNYTVARNNLLLVLVLTAINIVMMMFDSETTFLFSATIPYVASLFAFWYQWYLGYIIAGIVMVLYFLSWLCSKKSPTWMIVATVLFVLDTIAMLWLYGFTFDISVIFDLLVHVWVLSYLIMGIRSGSKIKAQAGENFSEAAAAKNYENEEKIPNASPLRMAEDTKHRVLIEETVEGKHIIYRRVKSVNELVINGYVYDEYEALVEKPHALCARIDEHVIEVGMSSKSYSYIMVDGEMIKKKMRLV